MCENDKELPLWSLWTRLTNISFTTPSLQPQIVEGMLIKTMKVLSVTTGVT